MKINKYKNKTFRNVNTEVLLQQIRNYVEGNKVYLNPGFSLNELSKQLNLSVHIVSFCINKVSKINFPDFINRYRVNHAIDMMKNNKFSDLSMDGIGLECGFGSPATFYRSFKKITGFTPTQIKLSKKNIK